MIYLYSAEMDFVWFNYIHYLFIEILPLFDGTNLMVKDIGIQSCVNFATCEEHFWSKLDFCNMYNLSIEVIFLNQ